MQGMRASLNAPEARIEILETSRQAGPRGETVFPRSGLAAPSPARPEAATLWRGYIRYDGERKFAIWARASRGGADLIVKDNGKGFDPENVEDDGAVRHFGLSGMQERAGYLGGRLAVRSTPGEGASVVMHIPSYQGRQYDRI